MTKKILCLALVALMLIAGGISAMANNTTTDINDNLVSYWNFEGSNETEMLSDKSTKGQSADNLTKVGSDVTFTDGVAYIPSTPLNYLQATSGNPDLKDVSSMTVFMKTKYVGSNTDFADLFSYQGLYRIYKKADSASSAGAVFEASAFATKNISGITGVDSKAVRARPINAGAEAIQADQWFYIALSMEITAENKGVATLYLSTDSMTYAKYVAEITFTDALLENLATRQAVPTTVNETNSVTIGKISVDTDIPDRGVGFYYDDIRIYNTVLDEMDLARIIPNSLELRSESEITTVATTTKATTTAASTTTAATTKATTTAATTAAATTTAAETTAEESEGCGGVIAAPVFALVAGACATCCVVKRKRK